MMIFTVKFGKNAMFRNIADNCRKRRLNKPTANPENNVFNNPFIIKRTQHICVATFIEKAAIGIITLI